MRQAGPGVLELCEVSFRKELGAWELGIEFFALCNGPASAFVSILPPCPLIESFGVTIAVLSSCQHLPRHLFHPNVERVVCEEVRCVHLVLTIRVFRDARDHVFGLFAWHDGQFHLDVDFFQLLGIRLLSRV